MSEAIKMNRRSFVKTAAVASGGLVIGFHLPPLGNTAEAAMAGEGTELNAWVVVAPDNTITIRASQTELGQGPTMGNLMMFAEEMECDWADVTFEFATGRPEYTNPLVGLQLTGGSTATPGFWDVMRKAGAQARHMLIQAAAKKWGVDASQCTARNSMVMQGSNKATFGDLAMAAADETPPEDPKLKSPAEFKLIGHSVKRLDSLQKVTGTAIFGMDTFVDGMVVGVVKHAPWSGTIKSWDSAAAKAVDGVQDSFLIGQAVFPDNSSNALVVIAETYWQGVKGMKAANPQMDFGGWDNLDDDQILGAFKEGTNEAGKMGRAEGDVSAGLSSAAKVIEAEYHVPYISHSPLEPMNTVADYRGDFLEIWSPTQNAGAGYVVAAQISGLPQEKIHIHMTFAGGGFGRRVEVDYIEQAVEASMKVRKPVKIMWSREEDTQHNLNRPSYATKFTAGLDADGNPTTWKQTLAGPGIWLSPYRSTRLKNLFAGSDFMKGMQESGVDFHSVQGAKDIGYDFANMDIAWTQKDFPVPIVFFRGVGNTQNAFFIESFLDEIAHESGQDPYELRRKLLHKEPRMLAALNLAAEKSGWGNSLPAGRHRGIAFHNSFDSPFCDVIEISVRGGRRIKIHKITRAIDCGIIVNPDQLDSQFQSGVVWGLTMAMYSQLQVKNGAIVQSNFNNYRLLRIGQMPKFETHYVRNTESPSGIGEPVFHTIAPALTNAIFSATGRRIRSLPLKNHGFSLA